MEGCSTQFMYFMIAGKENDNFAVKRPKELTKRPKNRQNGKKKQKGQKKVKKAKKNRKRKKIDKKALKITFLRNNLYSGYCNKKSS